MPIDPATGWETGPTYQERPNDGSGYDDGYSGEGPATYGNITETSGFSSGQGFGDAFVTGLQAAAGAATAFGGTVYSANRAEDLTKDNQRFTLMMDSTRYQRTMDDMRKAGLNPMLAYQQGGGSGGSGSIAGMPDAGAAIASGSNSGSKVAEARMKQNALRSQISLIDAGSRASSAQAVKTQNEADIIRAGLPAAVARGVFDASPPGQRLLQEERRSALQMSVLENAPGMFAKQLPAVEGFIDRKAIKFEKLLKGEGPPVGSPGYARWQHEQFLKRRKK